MLLANSARYLLIAMDSQNLFGLQHLSFFGFSVVPGSSRPHIFVQILGQSPSRKLCLTLLADDVQLVT